MPNTETPSRGSLHHASFDMRLEAATELHAQGWTMEAAMNHLEGSCDRAICCGWPDDLPTTGAVTIAGWEFPL